MNYSKAIKTIRVAKNLSQKDLAALLSVTANYISKLETGDRAPSTEFIEDFCKKLGVPYYLFALLASDPQNLGKLPAKETQEVANQLLTLLVTDQGNATQRG
jgi:transcriptional regulator with XRE-family HTH domain